MLDKAPNKKLCRPARQIRRGACRRRYRRGGRPVPGRLLLARPRRLHLEHQDHGRPRPGPRHAEAPAWRTTKPRNWAIAEGEDATEADGVARRLDHLRDRRRARLSATSACKDGRIWTLLTTMAELKGHEEPAGFTRPLGAKHGVNPGRQDLEGRARRGSRRARLRDASPMSLIIGGGQGGIALGARLRQLGVPTIIVEKNERRRRQLAQALQVALPARSGLVRPSALYRLSRRTGRSSRRRTRSATGWKCTPRSWS